MLISGGDGASVSNRSRAARYVGSNTTREVWPFPASYSPICPPSSPCKTAIVGPTIEKRRLLSKSLLVQTVGPRHAGSLRSSALSIHPGATLPSRTALRPLCQLNQPPDVVADTVKDRCHIRHPHAALVSDRHLPGERCEAQLPPTPAAPCQLEGSDFERTTARTVILRMGPRLHEAAVARTSCWSLSPSLATSDPAPQLVATLQAALMLAGRNKSRRWQPARY
jgi:hypothetical protein